MPKYMPEKRFSFISNSSALDQETFGVVQFSGAEGISLPYEFEIMLVSDTTDIDLDEVMAYPAKFTIHRKNGDDVDFHGILNSFEQLHKYNEYVFYRAHLVPRLWWLSITHHNQVCLNKSVPDIIALALKDSGLTKLDFEFKTRNLYQPIEYVCQYNESHFNFISRWLEREGLYYYFDQKGPAEKIIFTDTNIAHTNLPDVSYAPPEGLLEDENVEIVNSFTCRQRQLPQKIFLKDYNYQRPSLGISGSADVDSKGRGTDYIYGEYFATSEDGDRLAGIRAEILNCRRREFIGESTIPFIEPGYTFTLSHHYRESFNQQYLVESISHEGNQMGYLLPSIAEGVPEYKHTIYYRNSFTAIPSDVQYRAEKKSNRPYISGALHAKVDAEASGRYAELDDQGRYKVRLPFDESDDHRSGKASTWLRMMQPYANQAGGMQFPLTKGTEVLLTFIDGDPDRPVIAGAIANPETPSPVSAKNQTESVIKTGGNNRIRMEDLEGKERIIMETPTAGTYVRLGAHNDPPPTMEVAADTDITTYEDSTGTWKLSARTIAATSDNGKTVVYSGSKKFKVKREQSTLGSSTTYKFKIDDTTIFTSSNNSPNYNAKLPVDTIVSIAGESFKVSSDLQDFSSNECELTFNYVRTVSVVLNVSNKLHNASNGIRIRTDGQYWLETSGLFGEYVGGMPSESNCPNGNIKDLRNKVYNQNWSLPTRSLDVLKPTGISESAAGFTSDMEFSSSDTQTDKDSKNKQRWQYFLDNAQVRLIEGDMFNIQSGCQYDLTGNKYAFAGGIFNESHISWNPMFNVKHSHNVGDYSGGLPGLIAGAVVGAGVGGLVPMAMMPTTLCAACIALGAKDPLAGVSVTAISIMTIGAMVGLIAGTCIGTGIAGAERLQGNNVGDILDGPMVDNDKEIKTWAKKVGTSFVKKSDDSWSHNDTISANGSNPMMTSSTWVEKKIGDTYDFQRGNGIEVKMGCFESHSTGDSYEYQYGGTKESSEYAEGGFLLKREHSWEGREETHKYDPLTGHLYSYEFCCGQFTFEAKIPSVPTLKIGISTSPLDNTLEIATGSTIEAKVKANSVLIDVALGFGLSIEGCLSGLYAVDINTGEKGFKAVHFQTKKEPEIAAKVTKVALDIVKMGVSDKDLQLARSKLKHNSANVNIYQDALQIHQ